MFSDLQPSFLYAARVLYIPKVQQYLTLRDSSEAYFFSLVPTRLFEYLGYHRYNPEDTYEVAVMFPPTWKCLQLVRAEPHGRHTQASIISPTIAPPRNFALVFAPSSLQTSTYKTPANTAAVHLTLVICRHTTCHATQPRSRGHGHAACPW